VQEYIEEGQALHHCVFTNEYHLKEKSLILPASIAGKRIETIELSLETMEILQCRGLQNKNTEHHERIIELVQQNMKQIQSHTIEYRKSIFRSIRINSSPLVFRYMHPVLYPIYRD